MRPLLFLFLGLHSAVAFQGPSVHSFSKPYTVKNNVAAVSRWRTTSVDVDESDNYEDVEKIKGGLTKEFFSIGVPAFIQLAAEPLAALVDTVRFHQFIVWSRQTLSRITQLSCRLILDV